MCYWQILIDSVLSQRWTRGAGTIQKRPWNNQLASAECIYQGNNSVAYFYHVLVISLLLCECVSFAYLCGVVGGLNVWPCSR
jgi:hypothetical protein